ncbi:MAG: hypothetical protein M3Q85_05050 [Acidobacteriota bacterium]|nr:hypothetical protein [Acidobacteriota bacterium]
MHTSRSLAPATLLAVALLVTAVPVRAQDAESRAAQLAAEQEQKARALSQDRPGFLERKLIEIERAGGFGVGELGVVPGLFVTSGDIKRGSGPSLGPAYGKVFTGGSKLQAKAVYSIQAAKLAQVSYHAPPLAGDRLRIRTRARWQDVPEVAYHGIASVDSAQRDPALRDQLIALGLDPDVPRQGAGTTTYAETFTDVSATAAFRPVRLLQLGAGIGVERFATAIAPPGDSGRAGLFVGAAGVGADPRYVHGHGSVTIDSRPAEGYTRRGTLLRATVHDYRQQNAGPYSFRRLDGVAEQYVPILRGNWVLFFGLRASTTATEAGELVPFFLLPDLGGHDLRGFGNYRFRDRHSILVTAEYRWYAQEFLDGAIFYDAGKAVATRGALDFDGLHRSYGAGIRLHGPRTTVLRLELARSREGTRLILAFSPVGG